MSRAYCLGGAAGTRRISEQKEAELRRAMLEKSATIAYRYCPDEAEKAREILAKRHAEFLERYGDELVAFPDGKALEEAENARVQAEWDASDAPRPAVHLAGHDPYQGLCLRLARDPRKVTME